MQLFIPTIIKAKAPIPLHRNRTEDKYQVLEDCISFEIKNIFAKVRFKLPPSNRLIKVCRVQVTEPGFLEFSSAQ